MQALRAAKQAFGRIDALEFSPFAGWAATAICCRLFCPSRSITRFDEQPFRAILFTTCISVIGAGITWDPDVIEDTWYRQYEAKDRFGDMFSRGLERLLNLI